MTLDYILLGIAAAISAGTLTAIVLVAMPWLPDHDRTEGGPRHG